MYESKKDPKQRGKMKGRERDGDDAAILLKLFSTDKTNNTKLKTLACGTRKGVIPFYADSFGINLHHLII